jgi:hypothetical protein
MKKTNDELDKHPFYSDYGLGKWAERKAHLERMEKELKKRRKTNGKKDINSIPEGVEQVSDPAGQDGSDDKEDGENPSQVGDR